MHIPDGFLDAKTVLVTGALSVAGVGLALRQIRKERPADTLPAAQLARALDQDRIYLLSRLDPSLVEELDMIPLIDGGELTRLVRQHRSCIILGNAPRAQVAVEEKG